MYVCVQKTHTKNTYKVKNVECSSVPLSIYYTYVDDDDVLLVDTFLLFLYKILKGLLIDSSRTEKLPNIAVVKMHILSVDRQ